MHGQRHAAHGERRAWSQVALTLAVGSFSLAGGHTVTLALHLTAKARALLACVHALRARATITDEERGRATRPRKPSLRSEQRRAPDDEPARANERTVRLRGRAAGGAPPRCRGCPTQAQAGAGGLYRGRSCLQCSVRRPRGYRVRGRHAHPMLSRGVAVSRDHVCRRGPRVVVAAVSELGNGVHRPASGVPERSTRWHGGTGTGHRPGIGRASDPRGPGVEPHALEDACGGATHHRSQSGHLVPCALVHGVSHIAACYGATRTSLPDLSRGENPRRGRSVAPDNAGGEGAAPLRSNKTAGGSIT